MQLFLTFISCFILLGCATPRGGINNRSLNVQQYIQEQLSQPQAKHKTINLPKGTYHFYESLGMKKELYISNHDQANPKSVGVFLDSIHNVTIDGHGSTFVFHGRMLPLVLQNSSNVTLQNFSIDFVLPQIRQLEILEVDSVNNQSVAKISPSGHYQIEQGKITFLDSTYTLVPTWAMPFRADKRLAYKRADVGFSPSSVKELRPDTILISG